MIKNNLFSKVFKNVQIKEELPYFNVQGKMGVLKTCSEKKILFGLVPL